MRRSIALVVTAGFLLACGGAGGADAVAVSEAPAAPPADPGFGSVAYQTYKYGTHSYKFNSDTRVTTWWANSSCNTVEGTWTQVGAEVHVVFKDVDDCLGWDEAKLKQLSECSMASYWRKNSGTGAIADDDAWVFERKEPKCPK